MALVECVPNVSDGRRPEVIERIARAVREVAGVRLLDVHSDADHDRSVFTFAGDADAVGEAALALVRVAIGEIDMRAHRGAHPRLGAVDVVPFVPLADTAMGDCIALAHRIGREIARRHELPVYFYARAALRPDRAWLPSIRRPAFEGLPAVIGTTHRPDAGPAAVHPTAGAVAVGARQPLIAFNVELASNDLALAREVARAVRQSGGGLPGVQAMGVQLSAPARVQVSCNLLDFRATSLRTLFDEIARRATARGVGVLRSELVGLVPAGAVRGVSAADLRLDALGPDRVIEDLLGASPSG